MHNIQKMAFFGQIFTKWGPFWVPRFLKIAMFFSMMYVGRIFGETTIHFIALLWKIAIFVKFWAILGLFEPFLGTQNFWIFVPCIIYPLMTFSQQLSGINIVFHAFFKSFDSQTMNFGLKWGFLRGQFLLVRKITPKTLETCLLEVVAGQKVGISMVAFGW